MSGEYLALYAKHPAEIEFCWRMDDDELFVKLNSMKFSENEAEMYISLQRDYIELLGLDLKNLWEITDKKMEKIVPAESGIKKIRSNDAYIYKMVLKKDNKYRLQLYFQIDLIGNEAKCQFGIRTRGGRSAEDKLLGILGQQSWRCGLPNWSSGSVVHNDIIIKDFMNSDQKSVDLQKLAKAIVKPFIQINEEQWAEIINVANQR